MPTCISVVVTMQLCQHGQLGIIQFSNTVLPWCLWCRDRQWGILPWLELTASTIKYDTENHITTLKWRSLSSTAPSTQVRCTIMKREEKCYFGLYWELKTVTIFRVIIFKTTGPCIFSWFVSPIIYSNNVFLSFVGFRHDLYLLIDNKHINWLETPPIASTDAEKGKKLDYITTWSM